jgi:hypothetical protein
MLVNMEDVCYSIYNRIHFYLNRLMISPENTNGVDST